MQNLNKETQTYTFVNNNIKVLAELELENSPQKGDIVVSGDRLLVVIGRILGEKNFFLVNTLFVNQSLPRIDAPSYKEIEFNP